MEAIASRLELEAITTSSKKLLGWKRKDCPKQFSGADNTCFHFRPPPEDEFPNDW